MQQPSKFTPVLISSVVMLIMSLFPFLNLINLICCAGIILGGAAGTFYYAKQLEKNGQLIQNKDGIMIGLLSGIISAILYVILSTLIIMVSKQNPVELVYKMTQEYGFSIPPESEKMLQTVFDEYNRQGFSFIMIGIEMLSRIVSHCIFGPLGGVLAAGLYLKRRNAAK
ncbi:MAG: hypothetical protein K8I03_13175 [Ignavibacteria bacterium]|nr:hypothetical protein [Ignavibacteria bacterium]